MLRDGTDAFRAFRRKLVEGRTVLGMAMQTADTATAEIIAHAGFDFVWIETEHTTHSLKDVERLIVTLENRDCVPLVRVRTNDPNEIGQALDMGARIVNVPHVDTPEDAKRAVQGAKYYPTGRRGYATFTRSSCQGSVKLDAERMKQKNDETMLMVQIESEKAVRNAEAIAMTDGVDALFVGYADLSQDMGIPVDPEHPLLSAAIGTVGAAVKRAGKLGMFIVLDPAKTSRYTDLGFTMILCGIDVRLLKQAAESAYERFTKEVGKHDI